MKHSPVIPLHVSTYPHAYFSVGAGGRKSGQTSSIFSISIDSSGTRLATGGLDTTVRIWHLAALDETLSSPSLSTGETPKRLAAIMSRHTGEDASVCGMEDIDESGRVCVPRFRCGSVRTLVSCQPVSIIAGDGLG